MDVPILTIIIAILAAGPTLIWSLLSVEKEKQKKAEFKSDIKAKQQYYDRIELDRMNNSKLLNDAMAEMARLSFINSPSAVFAQMGTIPPPSPPRPIPKRCKYCNSIQKSETSNCTQCGAPL
jgi:hypothetical protein